MSGYDYSSRSNGESTTNRTRSSPTEYIERGDVDVSLTVNLTRGTGTRNQDEIVVKAKGKGKTRLAVGDDTVVRGNADIEKQWTEIGDVDAVTAVDD